MDRQKGNWAKINFNYPATEISMPIFNLVINHGQSPRNASYAYIFVPGINHPEKMETYSCRHLKIERMIRKYKPSIIGNREFCKSYSSSPALSTMKK